MKQSFISQEFLEELRQGKVFTHIIQSDLGFGKVPRQSMVDGGHERLPSRRSVHQRIHGVDVPAFFVWRDNEILFVLL